MFQAESTSQICTRWDKRVYDIGDVNSWVKFVTFIIILWKLTVQFLKYCDQKYVVKGAPSLSFSYWVLMGRQGRHVHDACSARPTTWLTLRRDRHDARPGETPALGRARRNIHISLVVALVWKQGCEWWKLPHESNKMMWQTLIGWCEDGQIWLVKSVKVSECMCFWVQLCLGLQVRRLCHPW